MALRDRRGTGRFSWLCMGTEDREKFGRVASEVRTGSRGGHLGQTLLT